MFKPQSNSNSQSGKNSSDENWSETRKKLKEKFSKLDDEALDSLKGDMEQLSSKLQKAYGYAKEKADSECNSFKTSLESSSKNSAPEDIRSKPSNAEASTSV